MTGQSWRGWLIILPLLSGMAACNTNPAASDSATGAEGQQNSLAETLLKLGVGYMQQGRRDLALPKLERALELNPNLPSADNAIAILYDQLGEPDKAELHYARAVKLAPDDANAQNNYGAFLCKRSKLNEAEEHFLLAIKNPLYETPELADENAGLCAAMAPDAAKAETYFRSALQINPKLPNSLYQMALINFNRNEYLSTRAYLQRYAEVAQPTPQSLWLGIRTERVLGDQNAISSYSLLLRSSFPDSDEARQLHDSEEHADGNQR